MTMTLVEQMGPGRATALAERLQEAAARLVAVIEPLDDRSAGAPVQGPGAWSIGKDGEHVAEAFAYHQWILCGSRSASESRPAVRSCERLRSIATSPPPRPPSSSVSKSRTVSALPILSLTDQQLDLPTKPPRARTPALAQTIERVLIGHLDTHRVAIEAKLRALSAPDA